MRPKLALLLKVVLVFALVGCVSIVINFPAAEVKEAARKIEKEIRSEPAVPQGEKPVPQSHLQWPLFSFGVQTAYAADVSLDVDTPAIRALKASRKARYPELKPYLDKGTLGEAKDGLITVRSAEGLDARTRVTLQKLVEAENKDRRELFSEFARANNLADVAGVQQQFARAIRDEMASGQWYQTDDGNWAQKR